MSEQQQHHYFATWALGFVTADTEAEAIEKLCRHWASDLKSTQLNINREGELGVTIWTCRVPLPSDQNYKIEWFIPAVDGLTEPRNHILTYVTKTAHAVKRDPADRIKMLRRELRALQRAIREHKSYHAPEVRALLKNPDVARCDNCGTEYAVKDLDSVDNLSERIYAGEEVPAGQCPDDECGACCFLIDA